MRALLLLLPLLLLLNACAPAPPRPAPEERRPVTPLESAAAEQAMAEGDYARAAREYLQLAATTPPPRRQHYQLKAAEAQVAAVMTHTASETLRAIDPAGMAPDDRLAKRLLLARIDLIEERPQSALAQLADPPEPGASNASQAAYLQQRAEVHTRLQQWLNAARDHVEQEPLLRNEAQRRDNQATIWRLLLLADHQQIAEARTTAPPGSNWRGWLDLVEQLRPHLRTPETATRAMQSWRQFHPSHPLHDDVVSRALDVWLAEIERPEQIALLLPFTGPFAQAGQTVRDGVLAAYYRLPAEHRPRLHLYDSGSDPERVVRLYQQAIEDGADRVIGPLDRDAVGALLALERLPAATLALNRTRDGAGAPGLYQFGLAPEDEAIQVAEGAWRDGHDRAIALIPHGELGSRLYDAFANRFQALGGTVLAVELYSPEVIDQAGPIRRLLSVETSSERRNQLARLLGQRLELVPRRRQDADLLFLVAMPDAARQIRPQLDYHHGVGLPIYATSHLHAGIQEGHSDGDLDGIRFVDAPLLSGRTDFPPPPGQLAIQYQRLYALGADALTLAVELALLTGDPQQRLHGISGTLQIDAQGRVRRAPAWFEYRNGIAQPRDE